LGFISHTGVLSSSSWKISAIWEFYFYEIVVPQAKETALSMAADGMKAKKIAHYLKVSAAMVQNWIDESMSVVQ
jgi:hypothetical protein